MILRKEIPMVLHRLLVKAVPTVVTGTVGAVAYDVLRRAVAKFPSRAATVTATAWGLRGVREAERRVQESSEQARLTVADVVAEAKERLGEQVSPVAVGDHDH